MVLAHPWATQRAETARLCSATTALVALRQTLGPRGSEGAFGTIRVCPNGQDLPNDRSSGGTPQRRKDLKRENASHERLLVDAGLGRRA
jgi:hypothetical protein